MADDKHGANTGGAMQQEQRMYIYRKGETVAREVKYNAQEGIFVMGEMLDNPPAVSSAPTGTSPLAHFYGTNKQEVTDEDLKRDENVYENREPKRENDEHWKKSTYLHDKADERKVATAAVIEQQTEQKTVSQEDERVHPDQQRDIERKTAAMIAAYEAAHGKDHPLTDKGKENIRELCTNYVSSQNKLKSQDFTTFEQPKLASDTLAYGMMEDGLARKDASRTLWDANNVYYADNMRFLAQKTADYQYVVKQGQNDSSIFRDNLMDPQKQNIMRQRAFAQAQNTAAMAEELSQQRKKRVMETQPTLTNGVPAQDSMQALPRTSAQAQTQTQAQAQAQDQAQDPLQGPVKKPPLVRVLKPEALRNSRENRS